MNIKLFTLIILILLVPLVLFGAKNEGGFYIQLPPENGDHNRIKEFTISITGGYIISLAKIYPLWTIHIENMTNTSEDGWSTKIEGRCSVGTGAIYQTDFNEIVIVSSDKTPTENPLTIFLNVIYFDTDGNERAINYDSKNQKPTENKLVLRKIP